MGSTACEKYVAIPHARLDFIDYFVASIGRLKKGINFDFDEDDKTYLIFMLLGPKEKPQEYLKFLAEISKLLKDEKTKEKLLEAETPEEFFETIKESEIEKSEE